MKNIDILTISAKIKANMESLKQVKSIKFAYALSKNIDKINTEVKRFEDISKPTESYLEYEKERVEICEKLAKKDENGKVKTIELPTGQLSYDIDTNSEEWKTAMDSLNEKYKECIDERTKQLEEYEKFLDENSDIEFHKVDINILPDDIDLVILDTIKDFITE